MADNPRATSAEAGAAGPGIPGHADADRRWLGEAVELSRRCPPSRSAFSVGALLISGTGVLIATGYSRERDPADHAEEVALAKAAAGGSGPALAGPAAAGEAGHAGAPSGPASWLAGATLYSTLEPCLRRASRPRSCAELILAAGIRRVVVAWLEPPVFVPGGGAAWLREAGVTVAEIRGLAASARAVNAHLLAD
jgi:pyrimidine deaminase RibD-like protein